jgi:putative ABC transport system permease protein
MVDTGHLLARWSGRLQAGLGIVFRRDPRETLGIGIEALARYKLRTGLSVLGVVLGVAAVIAMMSVSQGARDEVLRQVELMGLDNIVVRNRPMSQRERERAGSPGLTTGDAAALRRLVPLVTHVSPLVEFYPHVSSVHRGQMARVLGVSEEHGEVLQLGVGRGRFLLALDARTRARVCVLGPSLARVLFGYRDPLSESVKIGGHWYDVVGVLADRGAQARGTGLGTASGLNQSALVPLSALSGQTPASDPGQKIDEIWIRISEGDRVVEVGRVVEHTLSRLHGGADDVELVIPRELLRQRYRTQRTFAIVVGSVAGLSLLIGGIGIMNIMLASVLERTHEIGIRRTVGATRHDVTVQFLVEALLMTLSGGVAGILTGVLASWLISAYAGWATRISPFAVVIAFSVAFSVGLVFGIYPATKAARLNPIDALRYE